MTPKRSILTLATALAVALLTALTASAAQGKLPKGAAKITPGAGIGAVKLGGSLRPFPRGWSNPTRCIDQGPMSGCAWTAKGADAFPPAGLTGIAGPFVLAVAQDGKIGMISISVGDRDPNAGALRRFKTRKGIGFDSTVGELRRAYDVVRGRLADQWVLWSARDTVRTNFRFADDRLQRIEIVSCKIADPCGSTPDRD